MPSYILLLPIIISFFITLIFLPFWIRKANEIGLVWDDMNKIKAKKVAGSGGVILILGFLVGVLVYIAYRVFVLKASDHLIEILAALLVIIISAMIGLIDDLLGWRMGGLSRTSRILMLILAAIPLMVINAGDRYAYLPLIGNINFGLFYPLLIIPIGVIGATSTYNFLAGYNGLEAGQGIILLSALSIVAYLTSNSWIAIISITMIAALFAFLIYNFYPARVFPGDSLTFAIGSIIAVIAILGNMEKIAIFFFIPYIIETILKSRGKLIKHSFGKPNKDGYLEVPYNKVYGLEHLSILLMKKINIKPTEKKVVYSIWLFQIIIVIIGFIIFRNSIFGL